MLALADRLIDRAKNQADLGAHSKEDRNKEQHGGAGEAVSICHHRIWRARYARDTNLPLRSGLVTVVEEEGKDGGS